MSGASRERLSFCVRLRRPHNDRNVRPLPIAVLGVLLTMSTAAQERPLSKLLIHRDVLKPGSEATYKTIEEDAARFCAELKCPNVHLALESMTAPTEVLWLTAFESGAEKQKIIDDYAANRPLTAALAGISKRREGLLTTDLDVFTDYRADLSRGDPWKPAGARFVVVTVTKRADRLEGSIFEAPDGTRFALRAFRTREAADAAAAIGPEARVFAVRPYWGMPAKEWIAADPEFWKVNPVVKLRQMMTTTLTLLMTLTAFAYFQTDPFRGPGSQPVEPYRVIGNIYYVGAAGISAHIIVTPQGLILLDTGTSEMLPGPPREHREARPQADRREDHPVEPRALGPRRGSRGHAGADRRAGHGARRRRRRPLPAATTTPRSAGKVDADEGRSNPERRRHGDARRRTLTAHLTPGHTKGCTTWTTTVRRTARSYGVVFIGGISINDGVTLSVTRAIPELPTIMPARSVC